MERDRAFERRITREIGGALGVNTDPISRMAQRRADAGEHEYGHDFPPLDRDLIAETRDELADGCNYLVWELERLHRGLDERTYRTPAVQIALRHVVWAFEALSEL